MRHRLQRLPPFGSHVSLRREQSPVGTESRVWTQADVEGSATSATRLAYTSLTGGDESVYVITSSVLREDVTSLYEQISHASDYACRSCVMIELYRWTKPTLPAKAP
jgi:hypothetical protein